MYFSRISILVVLFGLQLVTAMVHKNIYCVSAKLPSNTTSDVESSNGDWIPLDKATEQACLSYKRRNEGKKHWSRCPDCETVVLNEVMQCRSQTVRLNDILFQEYCKIFGAAFSEPRATEKISWWSSVKRRFKMSLKWS